MCEGQVGFRVKIVVWVRLVSWLYLLAVWGPKYCAYTTWKSVKFGFNYITQWTLVVCKSVCKSCYHNASHTCTPLNRVEANCVFGSVPWPDSSPTYALSENTSGYNSSYSTFINTSYVATSWLMYKVMSIWVLHQWIITSFLHMAVKFGCFQPQRSVQHPPSGHLSYTVIC